MLSFAVQVSREWSEKSSVPDHIKRSPHPDSGSLRVSGVDDEVTLDRLPGKRRNHQHCTPKTRMPVVAENPGRGRILEFPAGHRGRLEDFDREVVWDGDRRS